MKPKLVFGLFLAIAVFQLMTPIAQIWKYEDVLRNGKPYKFRTMPVDPYDAFRGKYVALYYADTVATHEQDSGLRYGDPAYVTLLQDENGFAQFENLLSAPPLSGDYLCVEYMYGSETKAHFRLLFDRYFMEESKAPKAERAYRLNRGSRNQINNKTYVVVRIKRGRGAIENLFIEDQPIREFIKTMPN